jgi:hypothetical protein
MWRPMIRTDDTPASNDLTFNWRTDSTIVLGPGETKRQVFDLQVWNVCTIIQPFFNDITLSTIRIEPTQ